VAQPGWTIAVVLASACSRQPVSDRPAPPIANQARQHIHTPRCVLDEDGGGTYPGVPMPDRFVVVGGAPALASIEHGADGAAFRFDHVVRLTQIARAPIPMDASHLTHDYSLATTPDGTTILAVIDIDITTDAETDEATDHATTEYWLAPLDAKTLPVPRALAFDRLRPTAMQLLSVGTHTVLLGTYERYGHAGDAAHAPFIAIFDAKGALLRTLEAAEDARIVGVGSSAFAVAYTKQTHETHVRIYNVNQLEWVAAEQPMGLEILDGASLGDRALFVGDAPRHRNPDPLMLVAVDARGTMAPPHEAIAADEALLAPTADGGFAYLVTASENADVRISAVDPDLRVLSHRDSVEARYLQFLSRATAVADGIYLATPTGVRHYICE
jgi:hypothetical protein